MNNARIALSAPVYFASGDVLDGTVLQSGTWVHAGTVSTTLEKAKALEAAGYADIVDVDGAPYVWGACCGGSSHNHG